MSSTDHIRGIEIVEAFCAETGIPMYEMRAIAADHLSQQWADQFGPDHGEGMGTSDVSCHLSSLARYDADYLFDRARPLAIIAKTAHEQGKSYELTKQRFALLFAPA